MAAEARKQQKLYFVYAQKDEVFKQEFEDYLINLQQNGFIAEWIERQAQQGTDWSQVNDPRLLEASLYVLLLSPALLATGYCSGMEFHTALARRQTGDMHLIPILLHKVDVTGNPLEAMQSLPGNRSPVSSWRERHEAWWEVYHDLQRALTQFSHR